MIDGFRLLLEVENLTESAETQAYQVLGPSHDVCGRLLLRLLFHRYADSRGGELGSSAAGKPHPGHLMLRLAWRVSCTQGAYAKTPWFWDATAPISKDLNCGGKPRPV